MNDHLSFCGRSHRGRFPHPPPFPLHLLGEEVERLDDPPGTSGDDVSSGDLEMTSTDQCH